MEKVINNPLVSIIIPVYNGSNFLAEAIDSALGQTYAEIEVLVVNDGSSDNGATKRIASGYGDKIRYFEKENGGVSSALNRGLREMKGEYFSWLSHDDIFRADKIESQIKFATETGAKFIYSSYSFLYEEDNSVEDFNIETTSDKNIFLQMVLGFPIHGCTTLIHNEVVEKVGFFDETLRSTQDYDYWSRCAQRFQLVLFDNNVVTCRVHAQQGSVAGITREYLYECEEIFAKMARYIVSTRKFSSKQALRCVVSLGHRKFYVAARMFMYGIRSLWLQSLLSLYLSLHEVFMKNILFEGIYKKLPQKKHLEYFRE